MYQVYVGLASSNFSYYRAAQFHYMSTQAYSQAVLASYSFSRLCAAEYTHLSSCDKYMSPHVRLSCILLHA